MIWQRCIAIRPAVEPNFVAARGLPVELETAQSQLSNDFSVAEPCKAAHSRSDYNRVVAPFAGARQVRNAVALTPRFDYFPRNAPCELHTFSDGAPRRHQAGQFVRRGTDKTLGKYL